MSENLSNTELRCPCCGGLMVEYSRRPKNVTYKCTVCGVTDVRLIAE